MYAYAKHPDTIPNSYYKFIVQTGPIPELILEEGRKNVLGLPVDVEKINNYWLIFIFHFQFFFFSTSFELN